MQGCSWPRPLGRNSLRDGKELPVRPWGLLRGAGPTSPMQRGLSSVIPVCLKQDKGVLPVSASLPGTAATTAALHSSDLWMFAHSCLLMCLITKSCQDGALFPPALARLLLPIQSQLRIGTDPVPGSPKEQNLMPLVGVKTPASPKCSQSSWGRQQSRLPARHEEKEQPFQSRAELPSAARLALCPPARCQAKFFAISRSTPASRNALSPPAACANLQPSGRCAHDRSIPKDPLLLLLILAGPICNPRIFVPHCSKLGHSPNAWLCPWQHL